MRLLIGGPIYGGTIEEALSFIALIVILCALALLPAKIGKKKGYSFAVFYVFGLFAFLPALITALVVRRKQPL